MSLTLSCPRFAHQGEIPTEFTCEGKDLSPPLTFGDVPAEARSLALIVDDPDAPDPRAPKMTWVHWVVYDIPPTTKSFSEAMKDLPSGAKSGINDWKRTGWGGPCPPIGRHRYFFKLYALDTTLPSLSAPTKAQLEQAMKGHVLEQAQLVGTYEKKRR